LCVFEVERVRDAVLHSAAPLSSRPLMKRDGWLTLDRVIDTPVYQATLTWNRYWPSNCEAPWVSVLTKSSTSGTRDEEGCGLLADS
jgi:hypothetical protein